jgi:3-oxoacyl-[acyl-carrier protein] reductase
VTAVTFDFAGKVAVVTGAGGGIGQAYAEALAGSGASVMVADINLQGATDVAHGIAERGGRALACHVDVADPGSAAEMAERAVEELGGLDYLVNNAAIFGEMKLDLLISVDWDYLQRFMAVNLLGALNCTRACYRAMRSRGGGAIVNQSSTAAYVYAGFYGLAKAGINSLTQQLAHELGGMNIRVNAIAPGPIDTESARRVVPEVFIERIVADLALKRQGTPADLVAMCQFLLSDDAAWVTGHVFNVDGGQVMRA